MAIRPVGVGIAPPRGSVISVAMLGMLVVATVLVAGVPVAAVGQAPGTHAAELASGQACADAGLAAGVPCVAVMPCVAMVGEEEEGAEEGGLASLLLLQSFGQEAREPAFVYTTLSDGSGQASGGAAVNVLLCWTPDALVLSMLAVAEESYCNAYSGCNAAIWNQEVMEFFVSPPGGEDPAFYTEIDVSPQGQLFLSYIDYAEDGIANALIDCDDAAAEGLVSKVTMDVESNTWQATYSIPWSLVADPESAFTDTGGQKTNRSNNNNNRNKEKMVAQTAEAGEVRRVNLYRIRTPDATCPAACSSSVCEYMAWSPTMASPPNFHVPSYFGTFVLV